MKPDAIDTLLDALLAKRTAVTEGDLRALRAHDA